MKYLLSLLVLLLPSLAIAECPESANFSSYSIQQGGFNQQSRSFYIQLTINVSGDPTRYLFIGYSQENWIHNGDISLFNYIPLSEYESDPYLHGLYRAYSTGQLETDLQAGFNYPSNNGSIDLLSYDEFADNFWACDAPPSTGGSLPIEDLIPWFEYATMLLGVLVICQGFGFGLQVWDLVMRAKNNPKWWVLFFLLSFPSIAPAQGVICHKVALYQSHTISFSPQSNGNSSVALTVFFSDSSSVQGVITGNGFGGWNELGSFGFTGIPFDVYLSDQGLQDLWYAYNSNDFRTSLGNAAITPTLQGWPQIALPFCDCQQDPSRPTCPVYTPSGPDVPVYCGDESTVDTSPDDPNCGCPGQDYTICDGGCPDADNDLCCDEVDPKPDDPACTCTRAGQEGDCDSCPNCEKLLTDYAEDFRKLFATYGVDLSPFLGRNTQTGLVVFIPVPNGIFSWVFSGHSGWSFGSDESFMSPGPLKTMLQTVRILFRSVLLLIVLYIFTRSILRVFLD